jgi:putative copper export protein/mono/diheme cytochrome c family protein/peroxiredoxin
VIAFVAEMAKAAGYATHAGLSGGIIFLFLAGPAEDPCSLRWRRRIVSALPWLAAGYVAALTAAGLIEASLIAGMSLPGILSQPDRLWDFALGTRVGLVATLRIAAALLMLLAAIAVVRFKNGSAAALAVILLLAAIPPILGAFASHAAGDDQAGYLMPAYIVHVLAMASWAGGLPAWIALALTAASAPAGSRTFRYAARAARRFSLLATICIGAVAATGFTLAINFVTTQGDLLGTAYGLLLCLKVALLVGVLAVANKVRQQFLSAMVDGSASRGLYAAAARLVAVETAFAGGILVLAGMLSQATPAAHDAPYWWLPVRISWAATWAAGNGQLLAEAGFGAAVAALAAALHFRRCLRGFRGAGIAAVFIAGAGAGIWSLSVPAFPDTYARSTAPYLTVSIAEGMGHFQRYCTPCHGNGGLGDGSAAISFKVRPANLTEPHTALHTAGDMYWWLTQGFPQSGMPGFTTELTGQDRWDAVNFLRAFSEGFQARVLTPDIAPGKPWLGAPNFYFEGESGEPLELKNFRERVNVLLVFPPPPAEGGVERIRELARMKDSLHASRVEVLVVSEDSGLPDDKGIIRTRSNVREIRRTYELLSRTIANRGDGNSLGMPRQRMEFLIDRFGYIRARWVPEDEPEGWQSLERVREQAERLNREPRIKPPPDDHVH